MRILALPNFRQCKISLCLSFFETNFRLFGGENFAEIFTRFRFITPKFAGVSAKFRGELSATLRRREQRTKFRELGSYHFCAVLCFERLVTENDLSWSSKEWLHRVSGKAWQAERYKNQLDAVKMHASDRTTVVRNAIDSQWSLKKPMRQSFSESSTKCNIRL